MSASLFVLFSITNGVSLQSVNPFATSEASTLYKCTLELVFNNPNIAVVTKDAGNVEHN